MDAKHPIIDRTAMSLPSRAEGDGKTSGAMKKEADVLEHDEKLGYLFRLPRAVSNKEEACFLPSSLAQSFQIVQHDRNLQGKTVAKATFPYHLRRRRKIMSDWTKSIGRSADRLASKSQRRF